MNIEELFAAYGKASIEAEIAQNKMMQAKTVLVNALNEIRQKSTVKACESGEAKNSET